MDSNPLEMALAEGLLTPERAAALAAAVDPVLPAGPALPPRVFWGDLKAPVYGDDPTELIRNRFLYKGGMGLICGPTGIGKSAFVAQMMTHFAAGRALFGIEPGALKQPTEGQFFWMKWGKSRWKCKGSCCGFFRKSDMSA